MQRERKRWGTDRQRQRDDDYDLYLAKRYRRGGGGGESERDRQTDKDRETAGEVLVREADSHTDRHLSQTSRQQAASKTRETNGSVANLLTDALNPFAPVV